MEINAKDLRYGNKLIFLNEIVTFEYITGFRKDGMFWIKTKEQGGSQHKSIHFKPLPITEQLLLEFTDITKASDNETFFLNHFGFCIVFDGDHWCLKMRCDEPYVICYFKYFHQLQNAYKVLTNQELIKQ